MPWPNPHSSWYYFSSISWQQHPLCFLISLFLFNFVFRGQNVCAQQWEKRSFSMGQRTIQLLRIKADIQKWRSKRLCVSVTERQIPSWKGLGNAGLPKVRSQSAGKLSGILLSTAHQHCSLLAFSQPLNPNHSRAPARTTERDIYISDTRQGQLRLLLPTPSPSGSVARKFLPSLQSLATEAAGRSFAEL